MKARAGETFDGSPIPWQDAAATTRTFAQDAERFQQEAGTHEWAVIWAAGAATTSTSHEDAAKELASLEALLDVLTQHLPRGNGAVFLTSSAGGVYAGSAGPPFDAETQPRALSAYGELKLAQEGLATERLKDVCPLVVGRLSNLYGPGQNLAKLQGLVSRLALSAVTQQPINIFVPLDTIRDYIYVDDAANEVIRATRAAIGVPGTVTTQVIASGQPATVGQLIRTMNQVAKRRIPVGYGSHPSSSVQSADLRLTPTTTPQHVTPLPAGMKSVFLDILERTQQRSLTA